MKVFAYVATDPEAPVQAVARIWLAQPGKSGKPVEDWHPVVFSGSDPVALVARAEAWWAAELAAAAAKKPRGRPPRKLEKPLGPGEDDEIEEAV